MTTTIETPVSADTEALVAEYATLSERAEAINNRLTTIKGLLRERLTVGSHNVAGHTVQVKAGQRRLNTKKMMFAYPVDLHPGLYKPALDTTAVKAAFAPNALVEFYDQGEPSVVVS